MLGIPIPKDMDGRVLKEIFEHNFDFTNCLIEYAITDDREQIRRSVDYLKRWKRI